jgi:hypothetical protein
MLRVPLALVGVFALAVPGLLIPAGQADVNGAWELVIETRNGEMTSTVKFAQDGDKLKVSMTGPRGGETTGEGSIKGDDIQWSVVRNTERGQRTVVYKGTVQGGAMSGQADIGDGRSVPWKAVKQ